MKNWVKKHKDFVIGICLVVYVLATAIPVAISYGWVFDIRPIISASDFLATVTAISFFINGAIS